MNAAQKIFWPIDIACIKVHEEGSKNNPESGYARTQLVSYDTNFVISRAMHLRAILQVER